MKIETVTPDSPDLPAIDFVLNKYNRIAEDHRNVLAFFEQDARLKGSIAFNTLHNRVVFMHDMPWRKCVDSSNGTEWTDGDTLEFMRYSAKYYEIVFTRDIIDQAIIMLSRERSFCPIREYFERLQWDGQPRIATAFHEYLGAELSPYTLEVSSLFFRALVARVYQPGIKFDHVVVLQGGQGIGKSSFLRILGGAWYSDGIRKFEGKASIEALQGVLIGEIPELQGFSKAEIEEVKAFITRTEDRVRMAYGRRIEGFPRRAVLVGTTNDDDYLRDATGNRRFLPIICTKALHFAALAANREQLFAEAVMRFKADISQPLILTSPEAIQGAQIAQQKAAYSDPWEAIILPWLDEKIREDYWDCEAGKPLPNRDGHLVRWIERDRVANLEIFTECLQIPIDKINYSTGKRVSNILRKAGWIKGNYRFGRRYSKSRGYKRPNVADR